MAFTVLGAVAELERSIILERMVAGQRAAKKRGVKSWETSGGCGCSRGTQAQTGRTEPARNSGTDGMPKETLRRSQTSAAV